LHAGTGASRAGRNGFQVADSAAFAYNATPDFAAAPRRSESSRGGGFRIGQSVMHPKFGLGVIINAEGGGTDARVQVNFGAAGIKWLALSVAKLEAASDEQHRSQRHTHQLPRRRQRPLGHAVAFPDLRPERCGMTSPPRWRRTFTVLRYDTRGHGGHQRAGRPLQLRPADRRPVIGLLDALKVERTHFVGLSMGGMIGQHLALAAPQRLDKLVIANSTSRIPPEAGPLWDERIAIARSQGCAGLVEGTLGRWFTPGFRTTNPAQAARIAKLIADTPAAGYIGCASAIRALDITAIGSAPSRTPTLVIAAPTIPVRRRR
jgi:hypothetical protein